MANAQKTFALILGIVLLIIGIWGLFSNNVLGIFGVNVTQSILHIIAGAFGLYVGMKGMGPGYNLTIGWIGVVLGVLGFIPVTSDLLASLLNVNSATTWLHVVVGVVSLIVGYSIKE